MSVSRIRNAPTIALLAPCALVCAFTVAAPPASARPAGKPPSIRSARCTPPGYCGSDPATVTPGGHLLMTGHLAPGMLVRFRARPDRRHGSSLARNRLERAAAGLVVRVPWRAATGPIVAFDRYGRRSRGYGPIRVVARRPPPTGGAPAAGAPGATPLEATGMWIWYLSRSEGGDVAAIAARAHQTGVTTVFVKSSDGSANYWSQFSAANVAALKAAGLHVCAWQYVYGTHPDGEAALGARAVANGAECLVIDAEAEYEGLYSAAQTYIQRLRSAIGPSFPLALASFPYVDYHEDLPYSVFLGPGGAQFNAPQMYWKAIGTTVDRVYAHTFVQNRVYARPIFPLGQTYSNPARADIVRFRALAAPYGATGVSFWDWQETAPDGWAALTDPITPPPDVTPAVGYAVLSQGAKGDQVLWMQEHLAAAEPSAPTNRSFDAATTAALRSFQSSHGLSPSGSTDDATWAALLAQTPVAVTFAR